MKFLDYIKGQRRGIDAHRIEKDSMKDPFLHEAIEGFDNVDDDHIKSINKIQSRLNFKSKPKPSYQHIWQIAAASIVIIFGLAGYLLTDYHKSNLHAQEFCDNSIIDIYIPEACYIENIAIIAQHNSEVAKTYKPNISQFKIEDEIKVSVSKDELDILAEESTKAEDETLIEIYVPKDFANKPSTLDQTKNRKPEPSIGHEKYNLYLKNSLKRPTDDSCKDRKGKVAVEFSVNEQGKPYLFEVKYSLCGTCDNEAIRLIQSGPRWTFGSERVVVKVEF